MPSSIKSLSRSTTSMEFIIADAQGPYGLRQGRGLLTGRRDGGIKVTRQAGTALWDRATGAAQQTLEGHTFYVRAVAFSPDGGTVTSASHDSTVQLWDAATGATLQTLEGHTSYINTVV